MSLFQFVVQENCLYEGNRVFKQICGIPMGEESQSNFGWYLLLTYIHERNNNLNKEILSYRYIDVLIVKLDNDNTNLDFDYYPNNLKLELSSMDIKNINYLDINMKLENENLVIGVFDKRNYLNFKTIKSLHFDSNVHISVMGNVFKNGLNHIERLSSGVKEMFGDIKWCSQGLLQGYPDNFVKRMTGFYKEKQLSNWGKFIFGGKRWYG